MFKGEEALRALRLLFSKSRRFVWVNRVIVWWRRDSEGSPPVGGVGVQ